MAHRDDDCERLRLYRRRGVLPAATVANDEPPKYTLAMLRMTHTRGAAARTVREFAAVPVRIGCAPKNDLALTGEEQHGVSPHHAEIRWENHAYWLVDGGSRSGSFVNTKRISTHALRSGDEVRFGSESGPALRIDILGPPLSAVVTDRDGSVDLATAQHLVEKAVVNATRGRDKSRAIIDAKVHEATRRGARTNAILTAGIVVTFVALGVAGLAVYRSKRAANVLATEMGLSQKPLGTPVGTLPTKVFTGREIYERNRAALFVLAYINGRSISGCCSAFAIDRQTLVTNAHCVTSCGARGGKPVVVQNESPSRLTFDVVAQRAHPAYRAESKRADSPDVALLRVSGSMPSFVTLANDAELRALGPGDDLHVLGFPGRVMDPINPTATFLTGHIGRLMGFAEESTTPDKTALILHDAVTQGGNSGSPVFNQYGSVISVHAAHVDEEEDVSIGGQKTKVVDASPFRIAMRIDLIRGVPKP
jgi:pSer/pThr/pTyr-binding forkhead associated (FHA) protein